MKKKNVIKKYLEFKEILNLRKFKRNSLFTIYYRDNEINKTRVGILITKKHGNAVKRNLIKRQIRNIIDHSLDYKDSKDLIIVISKQYNPNEFKRNEEMLQKLLQSIIKEVN